VNLNFSDLPLIRINSRYEDRKFPLHSLTVLSGHSWESTKDYYNDGKRKNMLSFTVWQYTISGRGRIDKNNESMDIMPGTLMILNVPGQELYYLPETSDHWEFVFLVMIGKECSRAITFVENHMGNIIPSGEIPETMEKFSVFIRDLFSQKIASQFSNSSRSYDLCMTFLDETGKKGMVGSSYSFDELLILLQNNLHEDISVDKMASVMRLSRSHFTRLFVKNLGTSPRRYLENLRLKTALSLLRNESISVKEVANRVGIRDENYFCKAFKNEFGISPGKFKNKKYWVL
jgi:AraC-like DNA-binding protein